MRISNEELADALALRDLTDPAHGPHALQLLVDAAAAAAGALLPPGSGRPVVHRGERIVEVADNYDRLGYSPEAATRESRYSRYIGDGCMLRSQTSALVPGALRALHGWPALIACPGIVYRRDAIDRLHTGTPHQLDLWLIATRPPALLELVAAVVGATLPGMRWRTRPTVHPYTTEGLEIEVRAGDTWVEIGECGRASEHVLAESGLPGRGRGGLGGDQPGGGAVSGDQPGGVGAGGLGPGGDQCGGVGVGGDQCGGVGVGGDQCGGVGVGGDQCGGVEVGGDQCGGGAVGGDQCGGLGVGGDPCGGGGVAPGGSAPRGLAMGLGLDRLLMLRKGISDIRLLRSGDPRVAGQMTDLSPYRPVSAQPAARRDLSLALPAGMTAEDLGDRVREVLGPDARLVEEVSVRSVTPASGLPAAARKRLSIRDGEENVLLRIVLRDLHGTVSRATANALRDQIRDGVTS